MTIQHESQLAPMDGIAESRLPRSADGTPLALLDECPQGGFFELDQWLPIREQMEDALRLDLDAAIGGRPPYRATLGPCPATSMRHGAGLIFATALVAGLIPFLVNWIQATRVGTVVPFIDWTRLFSSREAFFISRDADWALLTDSMQSVAGLAPWLPAWQAAGLSALGYWLSWPLHWLSVWIVYGVGVLVVSHLLGARTTLQHFYAGTSYACLPFLLLALTPIPWLGGMAGLAALVWGAMAYVRAVRVVTGLATGPALISVLTPGALIFILALLGLAAGLVSALRVAVF